MEKEKLVLNAHTFENVSKMLQSPDDENAVTALMALEQMDFNSCRVFMALLYKESHQQKGELWKANAPTVKKKVEDLGLDDGLSIRSIFNTMIKGKEISHDERLVYLTRFEEMLKIMLKNWGFKDMIDEINIKITLK